MNVEFFFNMSIRSNNLPHYVCLIDFRIRRIYAIYQLYTYKTFCTKMESIV